MAKDISEKDIVIMGGQSVIRVITETGVTLLRSRENLVISLFFPEEEETIYHTMLHISDLNSKICVTISQDTESGIKNRDTDYAKEISLFLNDDYIDFLLDYGENEKFILPPENPDQKDSTDYYVLSTEEAQKEYLEFCRSIIYGST